MGIFKKLQGIIVSLYFISINFEQWDPLHTSGSFSISKLLAIVYILSMIPSLTFLSTNVKFRNILRILWGFFFFYTIINILNISGLNFYFFDITLFMNIILFWILINHDEREPFIIEKGFLSFAMGTVLLSFFLKFGVGIDYDESERVTILGENQNTLGITACISMLVIFSTVIFNRLKLGFERFLLLLLVPFIIQLLIESGSRVAFIALIVSVIVGAFLYHSHSILKKGLLIILIGLFFTYLLILLLQDEVLLSRLSMSFREGDLSGREIIWDKVILLIKENFIFGVGRTGYSDFSQVYFGEYTSPHNVILEILCFTGIIGLMIFFSFLLKLIILSYTSFRTDNNLLPILFIITISGLLLSSHVLEKKIVWSMFAYIVSMAKKS